MEVDRISTRQASMFFGACLGFKLFGVVSVLSLCWSRLVLAGLAGLVLFCIVSVLFWRWSRLVFAGLAGFVLLGIVRRLGPEMLQNSILYNSWAHFAAGPRNSPKLHSGGFLGLLSGLGPELLQNCILEPPWNHFAGLASDTKAWGPRT